MNSLIEKEKKLNLALTKLKNLNLKNPDLKKNIENLSEQKNQLEIEKQELEEKYKSLVDDYNHMSKKLEEFKNQERIEHMNYFLALSQIFQLYILQLHKLRFYSASFD